MNYKALTLFFIMAGIHTSSQPMDRLFKSKKEPVITKPYEPSFSAKYPGLTNIVQSTGLGAGLGYFAAKYIKKHRSIKSLAIGAATFGAAFTYNEYKKPNLLDSLLTNPQRALHHGNKIRKTFGHNYNEMYQNSDLKQIMRSYQKIKSEAEIKSPIFLITECMEACLLNRTYRPEYRETYEDHVIKALTAKLKTSQLPLQYTSFACGEGFQDLVIFTKFLVQNPDAQLDIHLLDLNHTPFTKVREISNKNNQIKPKENINLDPIMNLLIQHARKEWAASEKDDNQIKKDISLAYVQEEDKGRQLISYLQKTFPNATLSLHLHTSTNDYLAYLNTHNIPYPDVIATADIDDDISLMKNSNYTYATLCAKTLQNKPESSNIWLRKEGYAQANITSISLTQPNGTSIQPNELELDNNNTLPIYFKKDTIVAQKHPLLTVITNKFFN